MNLFASRKEEPYTVPKALKDLVAVMKTMSATDEKQGEAIQGLIELIKILDARIAVLENKLG